MRPRVTPSSRARSWLCLDPCWCLILALAGASVARAQDTRLPPTLLLPNYDRVHPGLIEALEAGAFIARARNAPAVAYNPAGTSLTDRTILSSGYGKVWIEMAGITTPFTTPSFPFLQDVSLRTLDNISPAFVLANGPTVTLVTSTWIAGH